MQSSSIAAAGGTRGTKRDVHEEHEVHFTTGATPPYPADWFDKFSWKSTPATVTQWPALADLVEQLKDQRQRLFALIKTLTPEQLDRVVGDPPRSRTFRGMIVHALHDEADHQGEIYLLKKLWKLSQAV